MEKVNLAVPIWHGYAHKLDCQVCDLNSYLSTLNNYDVHN